MVRAPGGQRLNHEDCKVAGLQRSRSGEATGTIDELLEKWIGRMARPKGGGKRIGSPTARPVAFSFVAKRSNNVDPEPTPDPFMRAADPPRPTDKPTLIAGLIPR
ncbi:hypothetical protein RND71_040514 [Anisodus tanguticus]|uniref:Uncharacterized protein n=1 Tax=Anisodus tanguticus TaxID=243964 RepID=A0AAE1UQB2_9SOLA|nr:hypothetical protein RND71_040514 [Anisodus tanguticus]